MFRMFFDYVKKKASSVYYWDGSRRFLEAKKENFSVNNTKSLLLSPDYDINPEIIHHVKAGPKKAHFGAGYADAFNEIKAWFNGGRRNLLITSLTSKSFSDIYYMSKINVERTRSFSYLSLFSTSEINATCLF